MDLENLRLQFQALLNRVSALESSGALATLMIWVLIGLVFAAVIVGAFELRTIYHLVEAQQWRSR